MNIAIVGSRTFIDYKFLKEKFFELEEVNKSDGQVITIVSGGAIGADNLAERLAEEYGYLTIIHKPDWDMYGKKAGFIRNQYIVDDADIVLAFHKNKSKGTQLTINLAKKKGIPVYIFEV